MEQLLADSHFRRGFRLLMWLLLAVLLFVRFTLLDETPSNALLRLSASLLEDSFTSLAVTYVLGEFILYISVQRAEQGQVRVLASGEITPALDDEARRTTRWYFKGATGRYVRSSVLDIMVERAREQSSVRSLKMCLLDPSDAVAVAAYAKYRAAVRSGSNDRWDDKRVIKEICTTLVRAACKQAENSLLQVQVSLGNTFSTFRVDAGDQLAAITREDPRDPAIACLPGGRLFAACRNEVELACGVGRKVLLPQSSPTCAELTASHLDEMLKTMGLDKLGLDQQDKDWIVSKAKDAKNPYA